MVGAGERINPRIVVQTKRGADIHNYQGSITNNDRANFGDLERKFPGAVPRGEATGNFNCHGLTFASRRTCIPDALDVRTILNDDHYVEVDLDSVLPGDIIIYRGERGNDIEHSGIVIENPTARRGVLKIPLVISKWGVYKELIHSANNCPYNFLNVKYYRMQA